MANTNEKTPLTQDDKKAAAFKNLVEKGKK